MTTLHRGSRPYHVVSFQEKLLQVLQVMESRRQACNPGGNVLTRLIGRVTKIMLAIDNFWCAGSYPGLEKNSAWTTKRAR